MNLPSKNAHLALGPTRKKYAARMKRADASLTQFSLGPASPWIQMANSSQLKIMTTQALKEKAGAPSSNPFKKYTKIVDALSNYEKKTSNNGVNELEKVDLLKKIEKQINLWFEKNNNKSDKKHRGAVLRDLDQQIKGKIWRLSKIESLKHEILKECLDESYPYAPNILLEYLIETLIAIYSSDEITDKKFKAELTNFLIADNDLVGATSSAIQASGGGGSIQLEGDIGKAIFPFLTLSFEIKLGAKLSNYHLIATECQSRGGSNINQRYCLMNMNGEAREARLGLSLKAEVKVEIPSLNNISETLEINSFNCVPSIEATAGIGGSFGGGVSGILLDVSAPTVTYFNKVEEIREKVFDIITHQEPQLSEPNNNPKASFSFFSHAYSSDTEIHAGASAKASLTENYSTEAKLKAQGEVNVSVKFSRYKYKTQLSNGTFKTQLTTIFFKQASASAKAFADAELKSNYNKEFSKEKERKIDLLNSLYYESTFMFQNGNSPKIDSNMSGFSIGHSVISRNLFDQISEEREKYIKSLARSLKVQEDIMTDFLNSCHEIVLDINQLQENGHFIEATFVNPSRVRSELDNGNSSKANKSESERLKIVKGESQILQSLRWRTALRGGKNANKTWFKLGLNLQVAKLGIELGRIEDASSLKLTDLVVEWYDEKGKRTEHGPAEYVPTSFLFM